MLYIRNMEGEFPSPRTGVDQCAAELERWLRESELLQRKHGDINSDF